MALMVLEDAHHVEKKLPALGFLLLWAKRHCLGWWEEGRRNPPRENPREVTWPQVCVLLCSITLGRKCQERIRCVRDLVEGMPVRENGEGAVRPQCGPAWLKKNQEEGGPRRKSLGAKSQPFFTKLVMSHGATFQSRLTYRDGSSYSCLD